MRNSFARQGLIVFAAQMAGNVLNFAFHSVVSRRIGVVQYGALSALVSGYTVFVAPALILTTIVVRYAAEFRAIGDAQLLRALAARASIIFGCAALVVTMAGSIATPAIAHYLKLQSSLPVLLTVGILGLSVFLSMRGLFQGVQDFRTYFVSLTSEAGGKVALAVLFTSIGWGLAGALFGWLLGLVISAAYTYGSVWLRYRGLPRVALQVDYRRLWQTSAGIAVALLCVTSLGFSDVIIVKHFFSPKDAGLYGAAALSGKMLFFFVSFVPTILLPQAAKLTFAGDSTTKVLRQALAVVFACACVVLMLYWRYPAFVVTALAGKAFVAAAPLLLAYGIAAALLGLLNTIVSYQIGVHRFGFIPVLALLAIIQIVAISFFHSSPIEVIAILIACYACALLSFVTSLSRPAAARV